MKYQICILLYICIGIFKADCYSMTVECPNNIINWTKRAQEYGCPIEDKPYECLHMKGKENVYVESCMNVVSYPKGTYPVMDTSGKRDAEYCPSNRYHNDTYLTNRPGLIKCPYIKHNCSGEGQITIDTTYSDNKCSCTEGYRLSYPSLYNECNPGKEDCKCIKLDVNNKTEKTHVTNTTYGNDNNSIESLGVKNVSSKTLVLVILICLAVTFFGIIIIFLKRVSHQRRDRRKQHIDDTQKCPCLHRKPFDVSTSKKWVSRCKIYPDADPEKLPIFP